MYTSLMNGRFSHFSEIILIGNGNRYWSVLTYRHGAMEGLTVPGVSVWLKESWLVLYFLFVVPHRTVKYYLCPMLLNVHVLGNQLIKPEYHFENFAKLCYKSYCPIFYRLNYCICLCIYYCIFLCVYYCVCLCVYYCICLCVYI